MPITPVLVVLTPYTPAAMPLAYTPRLPLADTPTPSSPAPVPSSPVMPVATTPVPFVLVLATPAEPPLVLSFATTAALPLDATALICPVRPTLPATLMVEPLSWIIESLTFAAPPLLANTGMWPDLHADEVEQVMVLAMGALFGLAKLDPPLGAASCNAESGLPPMVSASKAFRA